jgi:hypothetical protein
VTLMHEMIKRVADRVEDVVYAVSENSVLLTQPGSYKVAQAALEASGLLEEAYHTKTDDGYPIPCSSCGYPDVAELLEKVEWLSILVKHVHDSLNQGKIFVKRNQGDEYYSHELTMELFMRTKQAFNNKGAE